jgi:drug/metabolite transporter (DMT)-like permease
MLSGWSMTCSVPRAQWRLLPRFFVVVALVSLAFAAVTFVVLAMLANTSDTPELLHSEPALLVVGVVNAVVGSLQTACGYCAQRLGHQFDSLFPAAARINARHDANTTTKIPLVAIGIVLLACGTISAVVNLAILGQSVTAPFAALTLIFNGVLACTVLNERVTTFDVVATVLVVIGVSVALLGVGLTGVHLQRLDLDDLKRLFTRSYFPAIYTVSLLALIAVSFGYVAYRRLQRTCWGLSCFSIGAGLLSGFSSLCVKCAVEMLKTHTLDSESKSEDDLERPVLWLLLVGVVVCVGCQLKLMTTGLRFFGALKFVPPYHVFIIFSNMLNGMVYLDEVKTYSLDSAALFGLGCGLSASGVFLLLGKAPRPSSAFIPTIATGTHEGPHKQLVVGLESPVVIDGLLPIRRLDAPDLALSDSDSVEV